MLCAPMSEGDDGRLVLNDEQIRIAREIIQRHDAEEQDEPVIPEWVPAVEAPRTWPSTDHPTLTQEWFRWVLARGLALFLLLPAAWAAMYLVGSSFKGSAAEFDGGGWVFAVCAVLVLMGGAVLRGQSLDSTVRREEHEAVQARLAAAESKLLRVELNLPPEPVPGEIVRLVETGEPLRFDGWDGERWAVCRSADDSVTYYGLDDLTWMEQGGRSG